MGLSVFFQVEHAASLQDGLNDPHLLRYVLSRHAPLNAVLEK